MEKTRNSRPICVFREAEQMRQQKYRARGMNRPTSTAGGHSVSPRPVISALEKGKLKRYSIVYI